MSSYLLMLAGKFDKYTEKTKCGTELELYLEHKDAARFEPATVILFECLIFWKEIGEVPLEVYKQIPFVTSCMPEWKILRQLYFLVDMWSTLLVLKIAIIRTSMHMNWHINGLGI
jgi:hypothetical protein